MNAKIADAIRKVTAAVQNEIASGHRSAGIDANDVVEIFLAIADELDPIRMRGQGAAVDGSVRKR